MCTIFKDKKYLINYILGLLGGLLGYLLGKAIVSRFLDALELITFFIIFALLYGISLEIIARKK